MKNFNSKINRRSFVGKTGTAMAGLTLIPGFVIGKNSSTPELTGAAPAGSPSVEGWWTRGPLRIVEFEEGYEFAEKFDHLSDLGANMEHATRFTGVSPGTSFLDAHNLFQGRKVDFGSLKEYLDAAHSKNIRVIIYYNVHAIEINYARQHPDWQQIKDDGKPIEDVYSVDSSFCINSPWREEVFATLRKLAKFEIDGIFYDGPIFFASTCHCESCKKLYRERYNKDLPSKGVLSGGTDNAAWRELVEFQSDSLARFLRESNKILKEGNPSILFYMNGNTLAPSWPTARDNRKIIRETDILGAEGGFLYGEFKEPVYKPGAMAKLLETQSSGKPTVVFDAAKQGPWSFSTLPSGEMSILYSQTITHQANVWLAISSVANLHDDETDTIRKFNSFIRDNPDPFFHTSSMARIALVWPQESGNYYRGSSVPLTDFTKEIRTEKAGNTEDEFYGFYTGLSRNHIPFDVLDEQALSGDLSRYELIILPNVTCLSKEQAGRIRTFTEKGGNIISTFETSAFDESGNRLASPSLSDILGAVNTGAVFGPLEWDYVVPTDYGHFIMKGIKNKFLNAPTYGLKIKAQGGSPAFFSKPLPGSYSGSPELSELPFLVENRFGKGRSLYIAATFGSSLLRYNFPEYYMLLQNMVSEYTMPLVKVSEAPSSVEVCIRKKGSSVYLYLINFTSEMKRPIVNIIPCRDLEIELTIPGKTREVHAMWKDEKLKFSTGEGRLTFRLPELGAYEVIRISG
jgi:hypothetical protein